MIVIAASAVLLYVGILLGIQFVGNKLENRDAVETVGSLNGRFTSSAVTMQYNNRTWTYRDHDLTNLLLIGVDWQDNESTVSERYAGQADFLFLISIDRKNKIVQTLHIDRDTMTDIRIYGPFGDYTGEQTEQICLSYAYGVDDKTNCANTVWAVSNLLGGIPIDGYLSLDMSSIALINDTLGGVTVTLDEDFSSIDPAMTKGTTLTLHGMQAQYYVRGRMGVGDGTNASRMKRQRTFIRAAEDLLIANINKDTNYFGTFYDALSDHIITDVDRGWLINRAYECSSYARTDTASLVGSHSIGEDGFMQFNADEDALNERLTEMFFE